MDNRVEPVTGPAWGPARWAAPVTFCIAAAALAWMLLDHRPENQVVAGALIVTSMTVGLMLVRIRVRLRATPEGVEVTGPLHTRQVPWDRVATISMPHRGRFGRRGASLEIEVRPEAGGEVPREAGGGAPPEPGDGVPREAGGEVPREAGEEELLAFGAFDLGTDPARVGRTLLRLRREAGK